MNSPVIHIHPEIYNNLLKLSGPQFPTLQKYKSNIHLTEFLSGLDEIPYMKMILRLYALCKVSTATMMPAGLAPLETLYRKRTKNLDSESGHLWVIHLGCCLLAFCVSKGIQQNGLAFCCNQILTLVKRGGLFKLLLLSKWHDLVLMTRKSFHTISNPV